ncbi:MAG TPA: peptidylprolyl isomerase [Thermodesulfovibrionales bacterium]|nr:peptidylprolyl isomerase [Thermodesulfovibrionales bacterium]
MQKVKSGDTIVINYIGKLEDGTVFDSTEGKQPLEFTVGEEEVVKGLEQGVVGMAPGESKSIAVSPEKGYGPSLKERVREFDKARVSENFQPEVGQRLEMYRADGLPLMGTVVSVSEKTFMIDYNHLLAGKTLIFDTTLVEIL